MAQLPSSIEIAQKAKPLQITEIARKIGLRSDEMELYGSYKAKVRLSTYERLRERHDGHLINVTAITPTNAGEGKTCTSIGLTQALGKLKKRVMLCLREPSLGPVFGIKGGACGGGYAQVLPMEDINLHFTGDIHAVGAAHNLLAAIVDNHVIKGNSLKIDPQKILWRRVMDISDRQLRKVIIGVDNGKQYLRRESGFDITVASEVMAILALAGDVKDLKERLSRIVVAYTKDDKPITAKDLKVTGSMALLLKDAIKPNLVQTLEGQPVFVHTGPFANIAHGNNSIIATTMALKLADYVVTESGFGADLGTEKFFDIVCRQAKLKPDAVVLVVSTKALKLHGGLGVAEINKENQEALIKGLPNLDRHIENIKKFGVQPIVSINKFINDCATELSLIKEHCHHLGVTAVICEGVLKGGAGAIELAQTVIKTIQTQPSNFKPLYELELSIKEKINVIAVKIYGADGVEYIGSAEEDIKRLTKQGFDKLPINMARTQLSFTHDPKIKGAPKNWKLIVREVRVSAGAGFVVAVTGEMMLMPGLPKVPAAERIDISEDGKIIGLF